MVAGAETGIWSCDFGLKGNTPGRASAATLPELRQNWGRQALTGQQSDSIEWCLSFSTSARACDHLAISVDDIHGDKASSLSRIDSVDD